MDLKEAVYLGIRYFLLILFGAFNLYIFYYIFTPLTVYPTYFILSLFDSTTKILEGNIIFFNGFYTEIISACVAGAAYYLLLILNLSTPMEFEKRIKSLLFLFGSFLALNILRIITFMNLYSEGSEFFNEAHLFSWYFGSTILVVLVWFLNVWLFKIKAIPIYSDINSIFEDIGMKKNNKEDKKEKNRIKIIK